MRRRSALRSALLSVGKGGVSPVAASRLHRPCAKRPIRNGWNPRRRSTRPAHGTFHGSHLATSLDPRKMGLADRGLDTRTAGLERLEARLRVFDFAPALVDGGSVVDSSAACVEPAPPTEARYSSRTQPCSWVIGSDTSTQLPSRRTTCKFVPGE